MEQLELMLQLLDQTKNGVLLLQEEEKMDEILLWEVNILLWRVDLEDIWVLKLMELWMLEEEGSDHMKNGKEFVEL